MVLDGRNYNARLPLVAPIYGHSGADAVGHALGSAVAANYQHLRHSARLIGHTTYPQFLRSPRAYNDQSWGFFSSSYVQVAEHQGVLLPSVMTHVWAQVAFKIAASGPVVVQGQIVLTDGTNTDTSDAAVVSYEQAVSAVPAKAFTLSDPNDPAFGTIAIRLTVATARVTGLTPEARTVRVQLNSNGARLQPILASIFWEAYG